MKRIRNVRIGMALGIISILSVTGMAAVGHMMRPASCSAEAAAGAIPLRGVIEGFYGTPWQQKERLDLLAFAHETGCNAYIYAPKDDPYHREKWREPYPAQKLNELGDLIAAAKKEQVRFIFAVSPGLDVSLHGSRSKADRQKLLQKLETVYALGVRDFAIFFDDIKDKDGAGQAEFINDIYAQMKARHQDLGSFLTVPTEYFYEDMVGSDGQEKAYTKAFSKTLSPQVLVLYTGEGVAKSPLTDKELVKAETLYGRPLGVWWNYPVNDYMENKLALGPVESLPKKGMPAIFFNPMKYEALSKIALATGADYARDPAHYQPEKSWQQAIKKQYGPLAKDMTLFAGSSRHLENDWAKIGLADDPDFTAKAEKFLRTWPAGKDAAQNASEFEQAINERQQAAKHLQEKLSPEQLAECQPQLTQFSRLASASETAMQLVKAQKSGSGLKTRVLQQRLASQLKDIDTHEKEAKLSEKAMASFVRSIAYRR
ncbi:MAG: O-GlcNAcase nagJ [Mitsuokella multacida]